MRITETQLRKIIRQEIVLEGYKINGKDIENMSDDQLNALKSYNLSKEDKDAIYDEKQRRGLKSSMASAAERRAREARDAQAYGERQANKERAMAQTKDIFKLFSQKEIPSPVLKDIAEKGIKSTYLKRFVGPDKDTWDAKSDNWSYGVQTAASKMTISVGELKGINLDQVLDQTVKGTLDELLSTALSRGVSKVKKFFGMGEVRQIVREEVIRQLLNER